MNIIKFVAAPLRAVIPLLLLALAGLLVAPQALAQVNANPPERMAYQGFLADGNGDPLGNTNTGPKNYDIIFRIMGSQSAGPTNWTEQQTVTVDRGNFSVLLGEGTPVASEPHPNLSTLFATNTASDRYVEMTVKGIGAGGDNVTILPRLRLLTSPYAFLSKSAISANNLVNSAGNALVSSSGNSNLVVSGIVNATSFTGNGASLTAINATNITAGTLANARLDPNPMVSGTVTAAAFSGSGFNLLSLNGTNINNSTIELGKLVAAVQQALCPVGTILPYAGDTAPAGWLLCNGSSYANSAYPNLVAVIGNRFGSASGIFYVPDLRGRFLRGRDGGAARDPDRAARTAMTSGGAAGDAVGSVQADALQNIAGQIGDFDTYAAIHGTSSPPFWRTNLPNSTGIGSGSGDPYVRVSMDLSLSARTSSETRPQNAYVNYIIKF